MRRTVLTLLAVLMLLSACGSSRDQTAVIEVRATTSSTEPATTTVPAATSTTTPPVLAETFEFASEDSMLPIEFCRIRDITPSTPNGTFNTSSGFPIPEGAVPTSGEVRLWVIPIETTDYSVSEENLTALRKSLLKVVEFFNDQSYGKSSLSVHLERPEHWVQLPGTASEFGFGSSAFQQDFSPLMEQILARWQPSESILENDLVVVLLPPVPGVTVAQVSRRFDQKRFNNILLQNSVMLSSTPSESGSWTLHAHELGHSWLRLEDLYHFPNFGPFQDYMGSWDIMSNGGAAKPMFSSWARWRAGWIEDREIRCVDSSRYSIHLIEPVSRARSAMKSLLIPVSDHSVIVVEAREDDELLVPLVYVVDTSFEHGNGPWRVKGWFNRSNDVVVEGLKLTLIDRDSSGVVIEVSPGL